MKDNDMKVILMSVCSTLFAVTLTVMGYTYVRDVEHTTALAKQAAESTEQEGKRINNVSDNVYQFRNDLLEKIYAEGRETNKSMSAIEKTLVRHTGEMLLITQKIENQNTLRLADRQLFIEKFRMQEKQIHVLKKNVNLLANAAQIDLVGMDVFSEE